MSIRDSPTTSASRSMRRLYRIRRRGGTTRRVRLMDVLPLDPASDSPPYEQLRVQIASRAASGELPAGTRLPTVRALAAELGLATNTVAQGLPRPRGGRRAGRRGPPRHLRGRCRSRGRLRRGRRRRRGVRRDRPPPRPRPSPRPTPSSTAPGASRRRCAPPPRPVGADVRHHHARVGADVRQDVIAGSREDRRPRARGLARRHETAAGSSSCRIATPASSGTCGPTHRVPRGGGLKCVRR